MNDKIIYPPGHEEAVKLGCICPILDNRCGKGAYLDSNRNPVYWYNKECKLHAKDEDVDQKTLLYEVRDD